MFKRFFYFGLVNIAIIVTISIVLSILGVNSYLTQAGIDYNSLAIFCLVWGFAGSFISLLLSKWLIKRTMGIQIITENGHHGRIVRKVYELARASGIDKMPEVGIYNSPEVNAFATGPSKNNALVAVSLGLINTMSDDEIEGVLGHEIAHIANGDMVTMTLIQGIINAFVMFFARVAAFALQNIMRNRDDRDSSPLAGGFIYHICVFVFEIFFSFIAMFITSYFSRIREYAADRDGAKYAGREKMIAALRALQRTYGRLEETSDTMKCLKMSSKKSFMKYLATHPDLEDRIRRLEQLR